MKHEELIDRKEELKDEIMRQMKINEDLEKSLDPNCLEILQLKQAI